MIGEVDKHTEEKNEGKYLVFNYTDEKREVLKKYRELWDGFKNEIETINGGKEGKYGKDFIKTKFDTEDDLPLNKPLKRRILTIIVKSVFEEDSNFYPQFYQTNVCMSYKQWYSMTELKILKQLIFLKLINQKNMKSFIYNYFGNGLKSD